LSAPILERAGRWRALEGTVEVLLPILAAVAAWILVYRLGAMPMASRGLSSWELGVLVGVALGLTAWAVARLLYLLRQRRPVVHVAASLGVGGLLVLVMGSQVRAGFAARCEDDLQGKLVTLAAWPGREDPPRVACQVRGQPGSPYLGGALWRPGWDGRSSGGHLALFGLAIVAGALARRDRRILSTRAGSRLEEALRLAPAAGLEASLGGATLETGIAACANPTLWGEPCGQIYPANKRWEPGEPCARCRQPFSPCKRVIRLRVVSLARGDVEVLNGEERLSSAAWERGGARSLRPTSGEARWVELGLLALPDVVSVATALAIAHQALSTWAQSADPAVKEAAQLARRRASRVSCWLWFGDLAQHLNRARPSRLARLAVGPARLRDLLIGVGPCWLQLDLGLLPLELRLGYRHADARDNKVVVQDQESVLWIPVSPPALKGVEPGVWVPRVEGDALRAWLSTERFVSPEARGRLVPVPYVPSDQPAPASPSVGEPGPMEFVLRPVRAEVDEPADNSAPGASLSEWRWLEAEQIELLRQQALVLVRATWRS